MTTDDEQEVRALIRRHAELQAAVFPAGRAMMANRNDATIEGYDAAKAAVTAAFSDVYFRCGGGWPIKIERKMRREAKAARLT